MGESTISMAIFNGYVCLPEGKQNHWTLRWFMALSENNVPKTSHGFKKIICFALKIAIWVHIFCDKPKLGKNLADPALSNCRPLKAWNFEMKRAENAQTANPRCCPWLICTYIIMYIWRFEIDSNGCTYSFPMFSLAILISPIRTFFFAWRYVQSPPESWRIEPLIPKKANYTFSVYDEVSQTGTKKNFDGCYWSFFRESALP